MDIDRQRITWPDGILRTVAESVERLPHLFMDTDIRHKAYLSHEIILAYFCTVCNVHGAL